LTSKSKQPSSGLSSFFPAGAVHQAFRWFIPWMQAEFQTQGYSPVRCGRWQCVLAATGDERVYELGMFTKGAFMSIRCCCGWWWAGDPAAQGLRLLLANRL